MDNSWWPYEDVQDPPECVWIPTQASPSCDWDPECDQHNWVTERQKACQRCKATGIDPEHSHSGMYGDGDMEPPVIEPCIDCQFTVDLVKRPHGESKSMTLREFRLLHYPW